MRSQLSVGLIQRSVAQTSTPNSRARNTELSPLPQPRSITRMPGSSVTCSASSSASQSTLGPMRFSVTHDSS